MNSASQTYCRSGTIENGLTRAEQTQGTPGPEMSHFSQGQGTVGFAARGSTTVRRQGKSDE
jgi:hypothetical protein